jgi:hypothetical protein
VQASISSRNFEWCNLNKKKFRTTFSRYTEYALIRVEIYQNFTIIWNDWNRSVSNMDCCQTSSATGSLGLREV